MIGSFVGLGFCSLDLLNIGPNVIKSVVATPQRQMRRLCGADISMFHCHIPISMNINNMIIGFFRRSLIVTKFNICEINLGFE